MSRYSRAETILGAAAAWRDRCLIADGSVYTEKHLWTAENASYLDRYYSQNLDLGEGDFWSKLQRQLAQAPPAAKQLAAEMFWVLYLIVVPDAMQPGTKRLQIKRVWEWSGEPLPAASPMLAEDILAGGVSHPGTAYHALRWREFLFFVTVLRDFKRLPPAEREKLLDDPWGFATWLEAREHAAARQFRHVLLFLLFPDHFERIATGWQKREIVAAFRDRFGEDPDDFDYSDRVAVDREVLRIKQRLQREHPEQELDFYFEPLVDVWWPEENAGTGGEKGGASPGELEEWYRREFGEARVWMLGAGAGARLWPKFRDGRIIAIGWDFLGDLMEYGSRDEIREAIQEYRESDRNPTNDTLACWQFAHEMQEGDHVMIKEGRAKLLGWGVIRSGYRYDPDRAEYQHVRDVEWRRVGQWVIPPERRITVKTLTDFTPTPYREWLHSAVGWMTAQKPVRSGNGGKDGDPDPLKDVFLSPDEFSRILDLLGRKKNVILEGPPGVGKTFLARRIARRVADSRDDQRIEMVQFHQSYAYEDFVQGWRPTERGGFELRSGVFHEFCRRAHQDSDRAYVFIIDEINRANLSRVFGELLMLIEADKRGPAFSIPLTYSRTREERFHIPENVHLLGLMNTADRSLAMVDYALRRRFAFFRLEPAFRSERFTQFLIDAGVEEDLVSRIENRLTELNERIREDRRNLGPGFEIGHSYFVPGAEEENLDEEWYERIIRSEIEPLLREYWFDDPEQVEDLVRELLA